jgi:short-subunit dehydrogenase
MVNTQHLKTAFQETAIPIVRDEGSGTIVNISSQVARATYPGLSACDHEIRIDDDLSLARKGLVEDGITVSVVNPRITATDFR